MEFTTEDISRLYGQYLFIIEKEDIPATEPVIEIQNEKNPEETVVPPLPDFSVLTSGSPIEWKLRPTSKLVLVLSRKEFADKTLTGFLKTCLDEAGINTTLAGFGIMDETAVSWNFTDVPVTHAWVFGINFPTPEAAIGGKIFFIHPSLEMLKQKSEIKADLIRQLQAFATR
ncbi:MAG: hypothetical protein SF052_12030 [Bacteroidia bacterium]|nr:hypothetical protein [Bacteroidia bacterium]